MDRITAAQIAGKRVKAAREADRDQWTTDDGPRHMGEAKRYWLYDQGWPVPTK